MDSLTERYQTQPGTDEYEYLQRLDAPLPQEILNYLRGDDDLQSMNIANRRITA